MAKPILAVRDRTSGRKEDFVSSIYFLQKESVLVDMYISAG
jgi:hypothetical protein